MSEKRSRRKPTVFPPPNDHCPRNKRDFFLAKNPFETFSAFFPPKVFFLPRERPSGRWKKGERRMKRRRWAWEVVEAAKANRGPPPILPWVAAVAGPRGTRWTVGEQRPPLLGPAAARRRRKWQRKRWWRRRKRWQKIGFHWRYSSFDLWPMERAPNGWRREPEAEEERANRKRGVGVVEPKVCRRGGAMSGGVGGGEMIGGRVGYLDDENSF